MLLAILALVFVGSILLYNPEKQSLKEKRQTSIWQRLNQAKGTCVLGLLLIAIAWCSFDLTTYQIRQANVDIFALSWHGLAQGYLFQPLTCNFIHADNWHLLANVSTLLLLSGYERRVGTSRFLTVFLISALASSLLHIPFLIGVASLGASGGLCGLVAAYFLDEGNVSLKQWIIASLVISAMMVFMAVVPSNLPTDLQVDWLAHVLGAVCGAGYIRLRPLKTTE